MPTGAPTSLSHHIPLRVAEWPLHTATASASLRRHCVATMSWPSRSAPKEAQALHCPWHDGQVSRWLGSHVAPPRTCIDTVRWHAHAHRVATLFSPLSSSPPCHRRTDKFSLVSPARKSLSLPALTALCARACMLTLSEHGRALGTTPSHPVTPSAHAYKKRPPTVASRPSRGPPVRSGELVVTASGFLLSDHHGQTDSPLFPPCA
jgi:hypothetical protein